MNESIGQSGQLSFQRPLLILLDRNFDLATPLHHTWTYQALIHDCFDLKLNRIEMAKPASSSPSSSSVAAGKTYDLLNTDKFWKAQKGSPFPVVAESIQEELEKFKQYEGEIKNLKQSMVCNTTYNDRLRTLTKNTLYISNSIFYPKSEACN